MSSSFILCSVAQLKNNSLLLRFDVWMEKRSEMKLSMYLNIINSNLLDLESTCKHAQTQMQFHAKTNEMGDIHQYAFGALAHEATEVCFGILDADALDVVVSAAAFKY
ncbi:hypothetical protein Ocin01_19536 [Orchesella cincta]|uniref:Uncharacterized protein n=1 Tax=Orchesella cincta TaxID=48709 RepID=A0A1D2M2F8_ORCCI|nr:hypothetical protein Ocin01_19536 [Orchesella cincta]